MQCTPQEIEEKRRLALQKRAERLAQQNQNSAHLQPKNFHFKAQNHPQIHNAKPYDKPPILPMPAQKDITGKCSLISEKRFVVELSGFSTPAVDVFKILSTRNYNVSSKNWDFHIREHDLLQTKLQELRPHVMVSGLPRFVLKCLGAPVRDYSNIDLGVLDPELGSALMPFQQDGVRYGIDKDGRCLIADDMGLGKTFQALGIANYYVSDWPLLIITTSSMKNVWEETMFKYLPTVPCVQIQYMSSGRDFINDCQVLIVSHDMMSRCHEKLLEKNFGVIIIDESHTIKNFKAKCTQAAHKLAKKAKRIILLSGTPALSRPSELYSQLALIDDKFFGGFFEYSKRYCDGKQTQFGWDTSGKSNLQELEIILHRKFMIRRTKGDVLKMLPNKVQEVVTLDVNLDALSAQDRLCLNSLAEKFLNQNKSCQKHAALLQFFSETARIKIPSVCSYILQVLQTKQKFLVFAHHQKMMDAICKILDKKNVKYIRIDGNSTSEQRKYFVDKFQLDDNYLVAVLSIKAANAGITLTAAKLVLFAELHWNPSILTQAESRAHRIGQLNPVLVKYLLAPGTADDSIWPMLQEKQKVLSEVGLSKDSFKEVTVTKQQQELSEAGLTNDLDITFNDSRRTDFNTLDITSYFKNSSNTSHNDTSDVFDDDMDDILGKIEF